MDSFRKLFQHPQVASQIDKLCSCSQLVGSFSWQFIGTAVTLLFGVYVALYAKVIDISDTGHYSNQTKMFIGIFLLSVFVQVAKDRSKEKQTKGKFASGDFIDLYTETLSKAIRLLPECRQANAQELREALKATLRFITNVVASYHRNDKIQLDANVMIQLSPSTIEEKEFHNKVKFTYKKLPRTAFRNVLKIIAWANKTTNDEFMLPVHDDDNQVLFGAPKVFFTGDMEHHKDVRNIRTSSRELLHQEKVIKDEIVTYFRNSDFRSFVSIRVGCGKANFAVLSIQSNQRNVFGLTKDQEEEISKYILPFNDVLSFILQEYLLASMPE